MKFCLWERLPPARLSDCAPANSTAFFCSLLVTVSLPLAVVHVFGTYIEITHTNMAATDSCRWTYLLSWIWKDSRPTIHHTTDRILWKYSPRWRSFSLCYRYNCEPSDLNWTSDAYQNWNLIWRSKIMLRIWNLFLVNMPHFPGTNISVTSSYI